jgi:ATP-dependent metalloprotease
MNVRRNTLNQLLVEMDGFKNNEGILVIAATNLPEVLDSALLRPGRFDRQVRVDPPNKKARQELLEYYLKSRHSADIDEEALGTLAGSCTGFTGADIKNMVNMAAIEAVKAGAEEITTAHLAEALEVIRMGRKNAHLDINKDTLSLTAYHEAGHAILSLYTKGSDPIYKATLVPRGGALGMVSNTPTDEHLISKQKLSAFMDMAMGGRAAEELIFGEDYITQGAGNDFMKATKIAQQMVTQYGMSEKIGRMYYSEKDVDKELSERTQDLINGEVQTILQASYDRAKRVLTERKREHELLAKALLENDTLTAAEIKDIIGFDAQYQTEPSMCVGDTPKELPPRKDKSLEVSLRRRQRDIPPPSTTKESQSKEEEVEQPSYRKLAPTLATSKSQ